MEQLQDIRSNIIELRNRLKKTQDFQMSLRYLDTSGAWKYEDVDRLAYAKIKNNLKRRLLWKLCSEISDQYEITHQLSLKEFNNNIEKLMLEIGKLEILLKPDKNEKKVIPEPKKEPVPQPKTELKKEALTPLKTEQKATVPKEGGE